MSSSQANTHVRLAEKQVTRYREDVGDWQSEHDALARTCWPIEDLVNKGSHYLQALMRLDEAVRDEQLQSNGNIDALLAVRFNLREWLQVSEQVLGYVERLEREYDHVEGAVCFRDDIEMVRQRLESTRPIHIDELGRVFEVTGELVFLPGLTPDDILESLHDEREGRLVPLAE
jgi:hypothetical protein